ncbi:MAG TPA: cytochrome c [Vicinamibacterales bacterium]|nr:cytochrome c [Vicinamibacterales bacterium]
MKLSRSRRPRPAVRLPLAAALLIAGASVAGCRQDMHNTPVGQPLRESLFVKNVSTSRAPVEGTVARGTLQDDAAFFTGKEGGAPVNALPFALTAEVLDRGEQRFNIYCSPCHGVSGRGDGMIVRRGYRQPPSFHIDRLQQAPLGHFFDTMTNGFGAMPDYRAQIMPRDRWAIAAYVRALQLSQHATAADIPADERQKLGQPAARPEGGAAAGQHK